MSEYEPVVMAHTFKEASESTTAPSESSPLQALSASIVEDEVIQSREEEEEEAAEEDGNGDEAEDGGDRESDGDYVEYDDRDVNTAPSRLSDAAPPPASSPSPPTVSIKAPPKPSPSPAAPPSAPQVSSNPSLRTTSYNSPLSSTSSHLRTAPSFPPATMPMTMSPDSHHAPDVAIVLTSCGGTWNMQVVPVPARTRTIAVSIPSFAQPWQQQHPLPTPLQY
jgi:hypothetical protein